jgi:hypothetical protein
MFERFTDRARRVVVLAGQEARQLDHDHIGPEHVLLGLLREGQGVAVKALVSLGIDLQAIHEQVLDRTGRGEQAPSGRIPFSPQAKQLLEFSLREALQLGHNYIGTEHILLALIRQDKSVAAQVLTGLGADSRNVRREVILLLHRHAVSWSGETITSGLTGRSRRISEIHRGIQEIMARLSAIEDELGVGLSGRSPVLREYDTRIALIREEKQAAIDAMNFEQAARLREQEKELIRERGVEEALWLSGNPPGPATPTPAPAPPATQSSPPPPSAAEGAAGAGAVAGAADAGSAAGAEGAASARGAADAEGAGDTADAEGVRSATGATGTASAGGTAGARGAASAGGAAGAGSEAGAGGAGDVTGVGGAAGAGSAGGAVGAEGLATGELDRLSRLVQRLQALLREHDRFPGKPTRDDDPPADIG